MSFILAGLKRNAHDSSAFRLTMLYNQNCFICCIGFAGHWFPMSHKGYRIDDPGAAFKMFLRTAKSGINQAQLRVKILSAHNTVKDSEVFAHSVTEYSPLLFPNPTLRPDPLL